MEAKNKTEDREIRFAHEGLELRAKDGGETVETWATGYAVKYDQLSRSIGWGFREKFLPGAFDDFLINDPNSSIEFDTVCMYNHRVLLGRRSAGTLELESDEIGLKFRVKLASTTAGSDLKISIERGDVRYCSFAFVCPADGAIWEEDDTHGEIRVVRKVKYLPDVSPVDNPAYPQTEIGVEAAKRSYAEHRLKKTNNPAPGLNDAEILAHTERHMRARM